MQIAGTGGGPLAYRRVTLTVSHTASATRQRGKPGSKPSILMLHGFSTHKDMWLSVAKVRARGADIRASANAAMLTSTLSYIFIAFGGGGSKTGKTGKTGKMEVGSNYYGSALWYYAGQSNRA